MPRNSNRSVSEIAEKPEMEDEEVEEQEDLALALPTGDDQLNPALYQHTLENALDNAQSYSHAREAANIPPQQSVKELVGIPIVIVAKKPQQAALPETGEMRNGYQCLCAIQETREPFTMWVGQTVLMHDLTALALPFRTTIVKKGRTYHFS